jgi:hypothetical protein
MGIGLDSKNWEKYSYLHGAVYMEAIKLARVIPEVARYATTVFTQETFKAEWLTKTNHWSH